MLVEMEIFGDNPDRIKIRNALALFYLGDVPPDEADAIKHMLWFYECGNVAQEKPQGHSKRKQRRAYDFDVDAPLFYAAFLQQYGINLRATKNADLHWWEFRALFESLGDDTRLARVMYWRTADTSGMGKMEKKHVLEMRKKYALKDPGSSIGACLSLAERNARMKDYVKQRLKKE